MNVLMLTSVLPGDVPTGGEVASTAFLEALRSGGHRVILAGYSRLGASGLLADDTVAAGGRAIETSSAGWWRLAWLAQSAMRGWPLSVVKFESRRYARCARQAVAMLDPDVVIVDHMQMAWVQRAVDWSKPTVLVAHNVEHQMYRNLAHLQTGAVARWMLRREAGLMERWERTSAARATEIWTLTEDDANYFAEVAPAARVRPFDLPGNADAAPGRIACDIGIIGTWTWQPNRVGLEWFLDSIVPRLPRHTTIHIAGRGGEWIEQRVPGVRWVGLVPSASAFLRSARVIAVPSVTGGGVQVKTLDAIGAGRPVVATSVALRGVRGLPDYVACADDPAQFAARLGSQLSSETGDGAAVGLAWARRRRTQFAGAVNAAAQALA